MAVNVKITVELNGIDKKMKKLVKGVDALDIPLKQSGIYMESSIGKRFRNAGGSRGSWKPLAASTIKRHPHRAGGKPLNDTGRLRQSVTSGSTKKVVGKRLYYSMASSLVYAASHNFGYKQIPKREFLYFDSQDERAIKLIFEDYIKGLVK
jgi:phage gpG-like protein